MTRQGGAFAYNPALLSDDEVKAVFVARGPVLERIRAALREAARGGGSPHTLLIGQRGMGKTLMLRRLRAAVAEDDVLAGRFLALSFPEEQYNVARLSDFWANCLDALADARSRAGDEAGASRIDAIVAGLPDAEDARASASLSGLMAEAGDRRLLLLVDNLDLVLDRLKGDHWRIREVLSRPGGVVLIGASSAVHDATADYGEAFYDFFAVEDLRAFALDEAVALAANLGGEAARARLGDDPSGFGALYALTGGSPRALTLLFGVLDWGSHDVEDHLGRLLDLVTPVYRAQFDAMSPQAQQIVDALAWLWDPAPAARVAQRTRLDTSLVSSQLQRLVRAGIIDKVALPDGTRTGYQLAERLFNAWHLWRASARTRAELGALVQCLRAVYASAPRREEAAPFRALLAADGAVGWPRIEQPTADAPIQELLAWLIARAQTHGPLDARAQLDALDPTHRLRPVHAALVAATEGRDALLGFAPEVRAGAIAWLGHALPEASTPRIPQRKSLTNHRRG